MRLFVNIYIVDHLNDWTVIWHGMPDGWPRETTSAYSATSQIINWMPNAKEGFEASRIAVECNSDTYIGLMQEFANIDFYDEIKYDIYDNKTTYGTRRTVISEDSTST